MEELLEQLRALADETRLKIFKLVACQELCVCQIVPALALAQPTVSVHLAKLRRAGLVKERRVGSWSLYSGDPDGIRRLRKGLDSFLGAGLADLPQMAELVRRLPEAPWPACCQAPEATSPKESAS